MIHHYHIRPLLIISLFLAIVNADSDASAASADTGDKTDPKYIDNKMAEINKKTDQVKGFIDDIPKFLDSIHAIQKAEKEIADQISSDEKKVRAAQTGGSKKRRDVAEVVKDKKHLQHDKEVLKFDNVQPSREELLTHSIDYVNNTLPEVKTKLVNILETFLRINLSTTLPPSTHQFENDPDFLFPSIIPQSTLSETLLRYNISLQKEKTELLALENVILKMQTVVESALLEIYKLEDNLQDDAAAQQTQHGNN